jgi:hypothetical protein
MFTIDMDTLEQNSEEPFMTALHKAEKSIKGFPSLIFEPFGLKK